ncbi:late competence development ComFB family protein [Sedimentibacter sp. zth1]|uniref:late competence development ComFB family protein n=1 Tax=Sedimentibacter sp. zth1 TaxID=2816908 RepID=UPI001A915458|nr:late competence development ComFB family protein [Sedimentibacter sp. zth1]QSX06337.1 late competence development ComFB family protein [Sedimentibacter sp. zth1]
MIKNYMEVMVAEILTDLLNNNKAYKDICKCEVCIDDMMAKALNNITPFYITSKKGKIYGEYFIKEKQNIAHLITEVVKAIDCVSKNPRHDVI